MRLQNFFYILCLFVLIGCSGDSTEDIPEKPEEEKPEEEKPEESGDIVLGENTTRLTADFIEHVSAPVTGMEIAMDASVPKSLLPQKGDILLNSETSEKFPYGFLGKVSQVKADGNGYLIETEKAYLDEAFEKLYAEGVMGVSVEETPQTRGTEKPDQGKEEEGPTQEISWELYTNGDYKGISTSYTIKALHGCSAGSSLGFTLDTGFYFQYIIDINNKIKKPFVSFSLKNIWNLAPSINLEYSKETDDEIYSTRLATFPLVPNVGAGKVAKIILQPEIVLDLVARAGGKINMTTTLNALLEYVIGVEYKDGKWSAGINTYPQSTPLCESFKFSMEGSFAFGLECAFKAKLFSEELASLSIPFFVGGTVSAELSHESIASYDYKELSEAVITFGLPAVSASIEANILKGDKANGAFSINGGIKEERHLFPKFGDLSAERLREDKSSAVTSSAVTQDLLVPVDIDYKLYSEDGEVVDERKWVKYHEEGDVATPFEKEFSGLKPSWEYEVVPMVKLPLWGEVEASPTAIIDAEVFVETLGGEVDESESYITFFGHFDPETEGVSEFGFCYTADGSTPSVSSGKMAVSGHAQGNFSAVLQPVVKDKTYKFRAYLVVEGEIYYGETKTITLEEDLLIGKWKLIKNEGECKYDNELTDGYCNWPWGDLVINADHTVIVGAGFLDGTQGPWRRLGENIWAFQYEDEGEMLSYGGIIQELTDEIFVLYCPPNFFNDGDDPKEQSWTRATFQRVE